MPFYDDYEDPNGEVDNFDDNTFKSPELPILPEN